MIGRKIKKIRLSKKMTQSVLAGEHITRNMLSQIENGSAAPSLSTIKYIAEKLEMPAGYFLADEKEDRLYAKMLAIDEIKSAYCKKDYEQCISLCSLCECEDDELHMLLCECHYKIATDHLTNGRIISAHKEFNSALYHAEKTAYNVESTKISCYAHLDLIGTLYPNMKLEVTDDPDASARNIACPDIRAYAKALKCLENNDTDTVRSLLWDADFAKTLTADHLRAKLCMLSRDFEGALEIMKYALDSAKDNRLGVTLLYEIYSDMEICYREQKDFENAYTFATKKSKILPEMMK